MINPELRVKPLHSREIIGKLRRDLDVFDDLLKKRMQLMREELEELELLNNKELMAGLKCSEEDFKAGRLVRCDTKEELEKHLESL